LQTVALGNYQHVQGQYNISSSAQGAFILGNGTSDSSRSNLIFASGSQVQITGSLYVTSSSPTLGQFIGNQNGYTEFSVRNTSTGVSASGDIAVYANDGTALNNYIDMGINNSGLDNSYFYGGTDFGNAHDAYLYNVGGDLRIGNATTSSNSPSQSLFLFSNPTATPNIWITGSQVAIGKSTGPINGAFDISGSTTITGSFLVTGSTTLNNILVLTPRTTTPTIATTATGSIMLSGSSGANLNLYVYTGAGAVNGWAKITAV